MFFLTGVARYLFVPLAEAVVFAMLASYVLSRTLVPTMAMYLLKARARLPRRGPHARSAACSAAISAGSSARSSASGRLPRGRSAAVLDHPKTFAAAFLVFCVGVGRRWSPLLGRDFFPQVDAGPDSAAHARADGPAHRGDGAAGRRGRRASSARRSRRATSSTILDNIGLPYSGLNLSYSNAGTIGTARRARSSCS